MLSVTDEKLLPTEENPTTPPSPSFENLFPNPPQKVIVFRAHVSLSSQPDFSVQDPHFVFTFYYHHYFLNSPNLKNLAGSPVRRIRMPLIHLNHATIKTKNVSLASNPTTEAPLQQSPVTEGGGGLGSEETIVILPTDVQQLSSVKFFSGNVASRSLSTTTIIPLSNETIVAPAVTLDTMLLIASKRNPVGNLLYVRFLEDPQYDLTQDQWSRNIEQIVITFKRFSTFSQRAFPALSNNSNSTSTNTEILLEKENSKKNTTTSNNNSDDDNNNNNNKTKIKTVDSTVKLAETNEKLIYGDENQTVLRSNSVDQHGSDKLYFNDQQPSNQQGTIIQHQQHDSSSSILPPSYNHVNYNNDNNNNIKYNGYKNYSITPNYQFDRYYDKRNGEWYYNKRLSGTVPKGKGNYQYVSTPYSASEPSQISERNINTNINASSENYAVSVSTTSTAVSPSNYNYTSVPVNPNGMYHSNFVQYSGSPSGVNNPPAMLAYGSSPYLPYASYNGGGYVSSSADFVSASGQIPHQMVPNVMSNTNTTYSENPNRNVYHPPSPGLYAYPTIPSNVISDTHGNSFVLVSPSTVQDVRYPQVYYTNSATIPVMHWPTNYNVPYYNNPSSSPVQVSVSSNYSNQSTEQVSSNSLSNTGQISSVTPEP